MTAEAEPVDVKALMADVEAEVQRKREAGLYPPEVLVELDLGIGATGVARPTSEHAHDGRAAAAALGDLQRSSTFTALVTTASQKPLIGPLVSAARRGIRTSLTWYMNGILEQVSRFAGNSVRATGLVNERVNYLERRLDSLRDDVKAIDDWVATVDEERISEKLARLDRAVRDLRAKVENATRSGGSGTAAARPGATSWAAESSFDYFEFENRFRGDPEAIADRQRFYVDLFRGAAKPVVDLGAGRGEFLGLLREAGVASYGVDRHADMVGECRQKGFEIVEADVLEHLAAAEAGSLGGIFCCQMIEHLAPAEVPRFFELAHAALAVGAPLVVETINPESLFVFAHAFYVDLGHLRPMHPLTLEFLAQEVGFSSVKVEYLSPVPPEFRPQAVPGDGELVDAIDENFRRIDEILFGPQDFAIVAHR